MSNASAQIREGILDTARSLGMDPKVLATIISYETAGTFDPTKRGPTTQWGQHRGLIQFGEPQAKQHGVDWNDPINSQLGPNGAVAKYFRSSGWKPGMSELDAYSIVNAGGPGLGHRSDANNGGAPGTVSDKVNNQFAPHRARAAALLDLAGGVSVATPRAGPDGQPMATAAQQRNDRLGVLDVNQSVNGTDMEMAGSAPTRTFRSHVDDRAAAQAAQDDKVGFFSAAGMAIDEGQIGFAVARQMGRSGFEWSDDYQISEEVHARVTAGLPREYHQAYHSAVSDDHLQVLEKQTRRAFEIDQELGKHGLGGFGLRLGAAILDPAAAGVSALTMGAAAPLIYGAKVGRLSRMLRAGTAAGAVNVGIDGYLISQSPLQQWEGLAFSAAAGFALGGGMAAFGRSGIDDGLRTAMGAAARDMDTPTGAPVRGEDSAGAARVPGTAPDPKLSSAEIIGERFADAPYTDLGWARFDMTGALKSSDNPVIRQIGALLGADNVGNKGGAVSIRAAEENVTQQMRVRMSRFYRTYDDAFGNWARDSGKTARGRHLWDPKVRREFNEELGTAIRRPLDASKDTHVQRVAAQMKAEFEDLLQYGRDKNIKGFADIKANNNYLTRRFRIQALDDLVQKHGAGRVNRTVAESMMSANTARRNRASQAGRHVEELDYETALSIADSYVRSIRGRKYGDFAVNRAFAGDDMDELRRMLSDVGVDDVDTSRIIGAIQKPDDAGRISEAKFRLDIDETFRSTSPTGGRGIGIEDFLENDAEMLFTQYARHVIGAGEMEEALSHFKIRDGEGNLPQHAPSWATVKKQAADNQRGDPAKFKTLEHKMDTMHRAVLGIPQEPFTEVNQYLRHLRDFNFSRIGGQLGIAQLAEIGNLTGQGGFRATLQHVPALRNIFSTARAGKPFSDDLLNELEAIGGWGTDTVRFSPRVRTDDTAGNLEARDGVSSKREMMDHNFQQAKLVTSMASGMSHVNMALQRMTGRVLVQRFLDDAIGRRPINTSRLRSLGVSEDMHPRIQAQMNKYVDKSDGLLGRRVERINMDKWDDVDARQAFVNGLDRWSRRVIQENDMGGMPAFMSKEMGKSIFQFRSFMLQAYTKQLLNGVHHRDWEVFSSFMTSMFFGGLFYAGQTYVNSIGNPDRERILEERLSPDAIARASFQRAGFSSIIPIGVDFATGAVGAGPMFDFRTSDLGNQWLGNPSWDLVQNTQRSLQSIIAPMVNEGYEFSQQDKRALVSLPIFQNAFIIRNGLAMMGEDLPNRSQ